MNNLVFKKTKSEKEAYKKANSSWKQDMYNKYPELAKLGYTAMEIWKKNLQVNFSSN